MDSVRRLNRTEVEYLAEEPQFFMVALLRFMPDEGATGPTPDRIISHANSLLMESDAHPALASARQRIRHVPGNLARPYWEDDPQFDIRNHISLHPRPSPIPAAEPGWLLTDAMTRPLDPERPMWRVEIVPSFDDGSFGLLWTIHHAIADGISMSAAILLMTLALTPEITDPSPLLDAWKPAGATSPFQAARQALTEHAVAVPAGGRRFLSAARDLNVATIAGHAARIAAFRHQEPPRPDKHRDRTDTLVARKEWSVHNSRFSLMDLRLTARALGATITDLFLSAIAAAWPVVEPGADSVWARLPVSLRAADDVSQAVKLALALVDVPCTKDLLAAVRAAQMNSARVKREHQARTFAELERLRPYLPRGWSEQHLGRFDHPDVVLSNMPGFPVPLYCQGASLCDALTTSSLSGGWGKFTFITLGETTYGTLIEDSGPDGPGEAFHGAFVEAVTELCKIGEVRNLLARQRQFVALSPSDLDELTRSAREVAFQPGETIITAGEPADALYVIKEGSAVASVNGKRSATYRVGESFGEVGIFRGGIRAATVVSDQPSQLIRIGSAALLSVLEQDPMNVRPIDALIDEYDVPDVLDESR